MSDPDAATDGVATDGRDALPTHTTPTWEMELLVSGATTFGLLQLPSLLDRGFFRLINGAVVDEAWLLQALWVYSKTALITLILTFLLHLCLRGYWVALVGMNSVYPGGVRWGNLGMGPIARRVSEARASRMDVAIEMADNRASRVFGTGFGFAMLLLMPVLVVAFGLAVASAVHEVVPDVPARETFKVAVFVLLAPILAAVLLDRSAGARLPAGHPATRLVERIYAFYRRLGVGRSSNLLISLFVSHEGRARMTATVALVLVPVMSLVMLPMLSQDQGLVFADHTLVAGDASAHPAFYADSGVDPEIETPKPWIGSRVATGPYLAVFVPYLPLRQVPAMRLACPGLLSPADRGTVAPAPPSNARPALPAPATVAECLARLADLRVDDVPANVPFDVGADPRTGQRGILAMLPMQGLAPGRHVVSLAIPGDEPAAPRRRYRIAFWK
jgi:hypothetical protein